MATALRTLLVVPLLVVGASACVGLLGDFSVSSSANDGGPGDDAATIDASTEAGAEGSAPDGGGGEAGQSDFSLAVATPYVGVVRGATGSVGVTVAPSGGFTGAVAITVSGLPSGITADPLTIAAGQTSGTVTLRAPAGATLGDGPQLTVTGTSGALTHTATVGLLVQDASGTLDTTFGNKGLLDDSNTFASFGGMALQADGKFLICGGVNNPSTLTAFVRRFNADATPDTTFGSPSDGGPPGSVTIPSPAAGTASACNAITVLPSGLIFLTGFAQDASGNDIMWAVRLTASGSVDSAFGNGGIAEVASTWVPSSASAIAVDASGGVLLAGSIGTSTPKPLLARFTATGQIDANFGTSGNGTVRPLVIGATNAVGAAFTSGGDLLFPFAAQSFTVQRYSAGGILDGTFFSSGTATMSVGAGSSSAGAIAVQTDGSILLAGQAVAQASDASTTTEMALGRLTSDGHADTTFGSQGAIGVQLGSGSSWANGVAPDSAARIVVAGHIEANSSNLAFGVARFTPSGKLDSNFAGGQGFVSTVAGFGCYEAHSCAVFPDDRILAAGVKACRACPVGQPCNPLSLLASRYWP